MGLSFRDITHRGDLERDEAVFAAFARGEKRGDSAVTRVIRKDGETRWLELHITVHEAHGGRVNLAVIHDVTEQKTTGAALRVSEEKYHALFSAMDEGYAIVEVLKDENGTWHDFLFLEVNPAFEGHTGMLNAVGRRATEILGTPNPAWSRIYGRVAETGEPVRFEENETTLGRVFSLYVFRLGGEGSRRVAVLFSDITERKGAEEALHRLNETLEKRVKERTQELGRIVEELERSEQRFARAFVTAPFAAVLTTLEEDRFLEVNDAFCAMTGYIPEEIVGRRAKDMEMWASPEDQEKVSHAAGAGEGFRELELSLKTKDGRLRYVLMSATVIPDGTPHLLKMFYDITERKRSEDQLITAIEEVLQDTAWFSRAVVEKLAQVRSGAPEAPSLAELTPRERQLLVLIARGMSNKRIAAELGIAEQTVRNYTANVYGKLGVHSRAEAVVWARERGLS